MSDLKHLGRLCWFLSNDDSSIEEENEMQKSNTYGTKWQPLIK